MDDEPAPVSEEVKQEEVAPPADVEPTATVEEPIIEAAEAVPEPEPVTETLVEEKEEEVNVEPTVDLKVRIFLACMARVRVYRANFYLIIHRSSLKSTLLFLRPRLRRK